MKKKFILTLGSIAAIVTPVAAVVSCGNKTTIKEDNITTSDSLATITLQTDNFKTNADYKTALADVNTKQKAYNDAVDAKAATSTTVNAALTALETAKTVLDTKAAAAGVTIGASISVPQRDAAFKLFDKLPTDVKNKIKNMEIILIGESKKDTAQKGTAFIFKLSGVTSATFATDVANAENPTNRIDSKGSTGWKYDESKPTEFTLNIWNENYETVKVGDKLSKDQIDKAWNIFDKYAKNKDQITTLNINIQEMYYSAHTANVTTLKLNTSEKDFKTEVGKVNIA